ncbi:MAG: FHA domain-containing protein [Solirubrobacterales bacterium]
MPSRSSAGRSRLCVPRSPRRTSSAPSRGTRDGRASENRPRQGRRDPRYWTSRDDRGRGRAGESFTLDGERISIGRTPDAGVFLDDVTVSRNHALLVRRKDGLYIDDLGSLNGTYVNRRRIESHQLQDGDEIQIGKYKLSYLEK